MSEYPDSYIPPTPEVDQQGGDDLPSYEDLAAQHGPNSRCVHTTSHINCREVLFFERDIPLQGEIHRRTIRLVTFYKADADDVPLIIFEEKSNALEPASVARPATGA